MNGLVVSVDFADILALTLPRNAPHFGRVLVVTTPEDYRTAEVAATVPNANLFITQSFYGNWGYFAKERGIEEALDELGRDGWICTFDVDIAMPRTMPLDDIVSGCLYSPYRRICQNPVVWDGGENWQQYPLLIEPEHAGYFRLFHADDTALAAKPWYITDWEQAGVCDSVFQDRWPQNRKIRPPFEVLHLGPREANWFGRTIPYLDGSAHPDAEHFQRKMKDLRGIRKQHGVTYFRRGDRLL